VCDFGGKSPSRLPGKRGRYITGVPRRQAARVSASVRASASDSDSDNDSDNSDSDGDGGSYRQIGGFLAEGSWAPSSRATSTTFAVARNPSSKCGAHGPSAAR